MTDAVWSHPRRIAFRFGVIAAAIYVHPFPLHYIPKLEWLAALVGRPWEALVLWFAESVLGLDRPSTEMTGSGDTMFLWVSMLVTVIVAALGAAVWTALDRKRTAYPRLAAGSIVALRYVLAATMLGYGFAKIVPTQFAAPTDMRLDQRIGDMSPMGLLWTFMGYSQPYTIFGGLCEALGGVLLLWRRTSVAGALVSAAVMTNVVMLNMSYDVPVKLYSSQLLLIACVIAMPHLRRVTAAVLGYATAEVAARPRMTERRERARLVIKYGFLACLVYDLYGSVTGSLEYRRTAPSPLAGIWVVETWSADGVEHPPLLTDKVRWRKAIWSGNNVSIRHMTDERSRLGSEIDPIAQTIVVADREHKWTWQFVRPDPEHLEIRGELHGKQLQVTLKREPEPELVSRGFHWIQERPYHR